MLKPFARCATPRPMRPMPTMPSVAPKTSWPSIMSIAQPRNRPLRVKLSASTTRRAAAISKVNAKSAVASSRTPGVLVTITLRAVAAGMSMLSKPTATYVDRTASRIGSISWLTIPTQPSAACLMLASSSGRSGGYVTTSAASARIEGPGSRMGCMRRTRGRPPVITAGDLVERFGAQVAQMLGAGEHRSERIRRCVSEEHSPQRRRRAAWAPKLR